MGILSCLCRQWRSSSRIVFDEFAEVVSETQEAPEFGNVRRTLEGFYSLDLLWVDLNPLCGDDVAQVFEFLLEERTLAEFAVQFVLLHDTQNLSEMLAMLLFVFRKDEDIV